MHPAARIWFPEMTTAPSWRGLGGVNTVTRSSAETRATVPRPWHCGHAPSGDWNRLRKIKLLRPRIHYVDEPLVYHYAEQSQGSFTARDGERFLE
jgi:hypothetical protein